MWLTKGLVFNIKARACRISGPISLNSLETREADCLPGLILTLDGPVYTFTL